MDIQYRTRISVTANRHFFRGSFRGYVSSQARQPPTPEIAAFVADLNAEFGEQEIDGAIRPALHRRHGPMSGQLTVQCAKVITELVATANSITSF
ncbi:hypothetical protein ADM96_37215 [Burkholderia sp. ST111]|nr:hypothetical protein ADM96_37215 [Burkholderia sp. ST111]